MRIVALGAILMNLNPVKSMREDIVKADLLILTGNITNHGGWIQARKVIEILRLLNPNILAVMGSIDTEAVLGYLESENISLHGKGQVIDNVGIYGVGGGNKTLFKRPIEYREKEIKDYLEEGYQTVKDCDFIILVTHLPPYHSKLDKTAQGDHVGSQVVRSFIFKYPPQVLISSQVYGKSKIERFGKSTLVSPGPLEMGGYVLIDTNRESDIVQIKNAY